VASNGLWKWSSKNVGKGLQIEECLYIQLKKTLWPKSARTIPTERPPLVGEVSANFCR
jgi:hypothetical protein